MPQVTLVPDVIYGDAMSTGDHADTDRVTVRKRLGHARMQTMAHADQRTGMRDDAGGRDAAWGLLMEAWGSAQCVTLPLQRWCATWR